MSENYQNSATLATDILLQSVPALKSAGTGRCNRSTVVDLGIEHWALSGLTCGRPGSPSHRTAHAPPRRRFDPPTALWVDHSDIHNKHAAQSGRKDRARSFYKMTTQTTYHCVPLFWALVLPVAFLELELFFILFDTYLFDFSERQKVLPFATFWMFCV